MPEHSRRPAQGQSEGTGGGGSEQGQDFGSNSANQEDMGLGISNSGGEKKRQAKRGKVINFEREIEMGGVASKYVFLTTRGKMHGVEKKTKVTLGNYKGRVRKVFPRMSHVEIYNTFQPKGSSVTFHHGETYSWSQWEAAHEKRRKEAAEEEDRENFEDEYSKKNRGDA